MKIAQIGPGIMSIPPNGWGAVEMLIWTYYQILTKHGINVDIINTPNRSEIIDKVNNGKYDAIHIHYDVFSDVLDSLQCPVKIISSHYPFINEPSRYNYDGYTGIFNKLIKNDNFHIFASSPKDINTLINCDANKDNIFLSRLGVDHTSYDFKTEFMFDKTFCFSQIVDRKRQSHIQHISNIDFAGRLDDGNFITRHNYLGELDRDILNKKITNYSNFILISSVENTTPLVVKEALICGLGVVVSESVSVELDDKDFITVIADDKISDIEYIKCKIEENKKVSQNKRTEIRNYGIKKFDVEQILINEYIPKIKQLMKL